MNARVAAVIARYNEESARQRPTVAALSTQEYVEQRDQFLLDIGPESGEFLNILIKAAKPKLIVELGTSYGYSTVWLAEAADSISGRVVSLEQNKSKIQYAHDRIKEAGLESCVEFIHGDALENIRIIDAEIGFVLIDLWKELYIPAFDALHPKLTPGALVAADNICFPAIHAPAMQSYVAHVRALSGAQSVTVPVGSGIELTRFTTGNIAGVSRRSN